MSAISIRADDELEQMVDVARAASERAAELFREHLGARFDVEEKGPGDPVTRADRELDRTISAELQRRFPSAAIVGEESVPADPDERRRLHAHERVFFVDPIDGTREFIDGVGEFAVMIGLAIGGRAAAGVLALPAEGYLVAGRIGQRAFVERDGERQLAGVSAAATFADARMLVSRSHRPAVIEPLRRRLGIGAVVECGSVGVKVARLAVAAAELYVHPGRGLERWDTCAAEAVLTAAGGRFTDLDGRPIDYAHSHPEKERGIVATNGVLHPGVMSALAWAEREAHRTGA